MNAPVLEHGMAKVAAGVYLAAVAQPAAHFGTARLAGLRGLVVPDRAALRRVETAGDAYFASAEAPFLTFLSLPSDAPLSVVAAKLLVTPLASRVRGRSLKLIPLSFARATPVTELRTGWAVLATRSRTARVALADGETLTVRPDALVAWLGRPPTGFCPKLRIWDVLLPRAPRNLSFSFHGPATVWFEGAAQPPRRPHGLRA